MTIYLVYKDTTASYNGADIQDIFSSIEKAESRVEELIKGEYVEFKKVEPRMWENKFFDVYYIVEREIT